MKLIIRTLIIFAVALAIAGITYAANQSGVLQSIMTGRTEHGNFEMHGMSPNGNSASTQEGSQPARPGRGFRQGDEHGMGRGEGDRAGFSGSGIQELIKSLGIVAAIVAAYVLVQRLWSAIRGPRKRLGTG